MGGVNNSVNSNIYTLSSYINSSKKILKISILCLSLLCFSLQGKAGIIAVPEDETETTSTTSTKEMTSEEEIEELKREIDTIYKIVSDNYGYYYKDDNGNWSDLTDQHKIQLLKDYLRMKREGE